MPYLILLICFKILLFHKNESIKEKFVFFTMLRLNLSVLVEIYALFLALAAWTFWEKVLLICLPETIAEFTNFSWAILFVNKMLLLFHNASSNFSLGEFVEAKNFYFLWNLRLSLESFYFRKLIETKIERFILIFWWFLTRRLKIADIMCMTLWFIITERNVQAHLTFKLLTKVLIFYVDRMILILKQPFSQRIFKHNVFFNFWKVFFTVFTLNLWLSFPLPFFSWCEGKKIVLGNFWVLISTFCLWFWSSWRKRWRSCS